MPSELEGNITLSSYLAHQLFSLTSSLTTPIPPLQDLESVRRFRHDWLVNYRARYFKRIMQEITDVQKILQRSVDRLNQQVCAVYNAQTNVARLPDELLQIIFDYTVDRQQRNWRGYKDGPEEEPERSTLLSCTHVCRKWRNVALATSSLWEWVNPDWSLSRIETWLTRARQHPISIAFHIKGWDFRKRCQRFTKFFDLLGQNDVARFACIRINLLAEVRYREGFNDLHRELVDLCQYSDVDEITMYVEPEVEIDSWVIFEDLQVRSLSLTHLTWDYMWLPILPTASLRYLRICCNPEGWNGIYETFNAVQENLETLVIDWLGCCLEPSPSPVRMGALKSLSVKSWSDALDVIIAPQLTQLKVELCSWEDDLLGEDDDDDDDGSFCKSLLQFVSEWSKNKNCTLSECPCSVIEHSLLATSLLLGGSRNHVTNLNQSMSLNAFFLIFIPFCYANGTFYMQHSWPTSPALP